ncbi:heavy metal translocating P-type ATPase [Litorimonas sp. RW-G-Af-16]|uniref:heavy metal translocating P-type ATPase n=1 Tax=Litorimonas sp. RW-G-Af-16 TaxID=3241168 RepID=UPI00390CCE6B
MGALDPIRLSDTAATGCPSGLQNIPVAQIDPLSVQLDLTPYVQSTEEGHQRIDLIVQGAHCGGCLTKIERGVGAIASVKTARMNLSTLRLRVEWTGDKSQASVIAQTLSKLGFGAAPYDITQSDDGREAESKALLRAMAVAGFAAMNVMLLSIAVWSGGTDMGPQTHTLLHWISAAIALPTVAYAGRPFFRSAWAALKNKRTNMDVPISLAILLACSLSVYETVKGNPDTYFDAAVMLLFLLLIGRFLDARLRLRTGEAARRLAAMQVTSATRLLDTGVIETVPARDIHPGDRLLIPAGQRIAVDCIIESGQSDIDMQIATGETKLQSFGPGDTLYSGTTNLGAPLTVRAIAKHSDSFLSEITALVEAGEQNKSRFVRIADKAARAYVPVVHSVAALTFIGWMIVGGDLRVAALNAIAVLIITCPCALGLAVPAVQIVAAGRLFKAGVLVKSGDALERLAKTKTVIFDKTGTLTTGQFNLLNAADNAPTDLAIAAALAKQSTHPLARALHAYASDLDVKDVVDIAGQGLSAKVSGHTVRFGSAKLVGEAAEPAARHSSVWLKIDDRPAQCLAFTDMARADAADTIAALQDQGLRVEMLSGDAAAVVKDVADELGLSRAKGGVSPKQKMQIIQTRGIEGRYPLMVGDGINDAPALAAGYSSASLASAADVSRSAADIILQGDRLSSLPVAIDIARAAQRRVVENLTLAVGYNFIAIPLAVLGFVNPLIAAVAMSGSSLIVTLNALRLHRNNHSVFEAEGVS